MQTKLSLNGTPLQTLAERVATLRKQIAFSERFLADMSKPIEHRIAERKALNSRKLSLVMLGFGE